MSSTPRLSLHSVLRFLHSREGAGLVEHVLERTLRAHGGTLAQAPATTAWPELPRTSPTADGFDRTVGELLAHHYTAQSARFNVPRAVVAALAQAADANGYVSVDELEAKLGPSAKLVATQIGELMGTPMVVRPSSRQKTQYSRMSRALRTQIQCSAEHPGELRARMALLDDVRFLLQGLSLEGWKMVTVQHVFPTTPVLFDELEHFGLERDRTRAMGKRYSTHAEGFVGLEARDWLIDPRSMDGQVLEARELYSPVANDEHMRAMARDNLRAIFADIPDPATYQGKGVILLDEGGFLLETLYREFPEYAHLCVTIETTENGMQRWDAMAKEGFELKGPLIDLARSVGKKVMGGAVFGESCVHATSQQLDRLDSTMCLVNRPHEAAVIGYGSMGKGVIEALLRRGFAREDIWVTDTDPMALQQAAAAGHRVGPLETVLPHGHHLFSGTGNTTLHPEHYDLLPPGAVLANVGSGRHELIPKSALLNGEEYAPCQRVIAGEQIDDRTYAVFDGKKVMLSEEPGIERMGHEIVRTPSGKELLFLRRGYVVNMGIGTPPEFVQYLFGLMLLAVNQATHEKRAEVVALDPDGQRALGARFEARLTEAKLSVNAPDYRKVAPWTT